MSTAIVYYSQHHGNTKKLLDAIRESDPDIKLIDTTKTKVEDLSPYDRIGIAKDHPTEDEIAGAVHFYETLL